MSAPARERYVTKGPSLSPSQLRLFTDSSLIRNLGRAAAKSRVQGLAGRGSATCHTVGAGGNETCAVRTAAYMHAMDHPRVISPMPYALHSLFLAAPRGTHTSRHGPTPFTRDRPRPPLSHAATTQAAAAACFARAPWRVARGRLAAHPTTSLPNRVSSNAVHPRGRGAQRGCLQARNRCRKASRAASTWRSRLTRPRLCRTGWAP